MKKLLFVCLGNICRSPTAEAVFRKKFKEQDMDIQVDSAGTCGNHIGQRSDPRSIHHAGLRGYQMTHLARQFSVDDFEAFDLIFVMDQDNYKNVSVLALSSSHRQKIFQVADFLSSKDFAQIPDPYYGTDKDFELVVDLLEDSFENICKALLNLKG